VQFQPDAEALLDAIAELLEQHVIDAVPADLQHRVRVAAHLCRVLEREAARGSDLAAEERRRLAVLGFSAGDLSSARSELAQRLEDPEPIAPEQDAAILEALLATVNGDLSISKPGYGES
jgi:hypothetical protein